MDDERFDLVVRTLVAPRSRRTVLGITVGGIIAGLDLADAEAKKRRKKKQKKRPSCSACADNEECVGGRCVSLARGCRVDDYGCGTGGDPVICGDAGDPLAERGRCDLTQGGNPICARAIQCHSCTSHDDCERQGWGPRGVCLSECRVRCGEGKPSCAVPYGQPCRAPGESCFADADCCSQRCEEKLCRLTPPYCYGPSQVCQFSFQCCSGDCGWPQEPFCES
jgi:hypothetical protein